MFKHILIATDGSDLATKAVATGLNLAKSLGASVTFVTVTEPRTNLVPDPALVSSPADEYEATLTTTAMAILTSASAEASKHGIPCDAVHVRNDFPAEGILRRPKVKDAMSSSWHPMDEEASRDWSSGASPCGCSRIVRCQSSSAVDRTRRPRLAILCNRQTPGASLAVPQAQDVRDQVIHVVGVNDEVRHGRVHRA